MASKYKLLSMSLLTAMMTIAGGCSSDESSKSTAMSDGPAKEKILPYWLDRRVTAGEAEPMPEPVKPAAAPVATGNCASYRPAAGAGMGVSMMAFPTGDTRSSALLVHQVMPSQVRAGAEYDYEIHVTNITSGNLQNVVVNGESIENMAIISSTPTAGRDAAGNAQWIIGDMPSCKTVVIKSKARAEKVGNASTCLSVAYNNSLCAVTQVVQPALQLAKTITPSASFCDPIVANFEVKNTGTGVAEGIVIKDELPDGLTGPNGTRMVEIPVGTLAAGQSATRSVQLKATRTGKFDNKATATATGGLTAASGTVSTMVTRPVLDIAIKCPTRVFLGRDICYEVTVKNTGDGVANSAVVTANLPAGSTFVRADNGGASTGAAVSWNLGALAAGASKTLTFCVRGSTAGSVATSATINAACADAKTANCSTTLEGIPAILVECIDVDDPDEVGTDETYIITVTNQGTAPGTGIKLVCEIPGEMSYVSATGTAPSVAGQTVTFAPLPTLAPKAKHEWRVTVKCNKPGDVRFRIRVTSDQFSNPIEETESTNLYQ
jgi:uncharacterized repeat protein (TIGR01451 family)